MKKIVLSALYLCLHATTVHASERVIAKRALPAPIVSWAPISTGQMTMAVPIFGQPRWSITVEDEKGQKREIEVSNQVYKSLVVGDFLSIKK